MNYTYSPDAILGFVVLPAVLGMLFFSLIYKRYLRIRFLRAFLLAVGGLVVSISTAFATQGEIIHNSPVAHPSSSTVSGDFFVAFLAWIATVYLGLALAGMLYCVWIMDAATPDEREPNARGFRAWLGIANILMAVLFSVTAYGALGWSITGTLAGILVALLAYPVVNCILKQRPTASSHPGELADERRRVLALVESGKITGEDGAELISALGQSHEVAASDFGPITPNRRILLLAAILVLIGFCLPWFSIDLGMESRAALDAVQEAMPQYINPPGSVPVPVSVRQWLIVRGGDIHYALGWIVLACALGAAILPLVWPTRRNNRDVQRGTTLIALLAGSVILLYLAMESFPHLEVGIIIVVAGYVALWIGAIREYFRPAVADIAVPALH